MDVGKTSNPSDRAKGEDRGGRARDEGAQGGGSGGVRARGMATGVCLSPNKVAEIKAVKEPLVRIKRREGNKNTKQNEIATERWP